MPVTREGARAAAYPRAVIVAAVVSPHPPLLLRELTGRVDVAAGLRATAVSALAGATASAPDVVVVVGGDDTGGAWDPGLPLDVRRFGTTGARPSPGTPALPLSLAVGRRLLDEAGWSGPTRMHAVARDASAADVDALAGELTRPGERAVLLVLGDGSARRGEKAPGYLDERAFAFDDELAGALEKGDAAAPRAPRPRPGRRADGARPVRVRGARRRRAPARAPRRRPGCCTATTRSG